MAIKVDTSGSAVDYSSLFSSLSTNDSSNSSSSLLTDWASIKNGSYSKLTKAYYSESRVSAVDSDEAKSTIKSNTQMKSDATDMKESLSKLSSASIYEKKTSKSEDGSTTSDYDYDTIYKTLKNFVDSYNNVIDVADDSNNSGVLRNAASMTKATATNQNLLSDIGITIGEDNKLSINETEVKGASINTIKSLFTGGGSYGASVEASATELINKINAENNKLSSYTASGTYDSSDSIGKIYDGTY